jgi:hypothetical protein
VFELEIVIFTTENKLKMQRNYFGGYSRQPRRQQPPEKARLATRHKSLHQRLHSLRTKA